MDYNAGMILNFLKSSLELYKLREEADNAFLQTLKDLEKEDINVLEEFTFAVYYDKIYRPNCLLVDRYRYILNKGVVA